jgi:hypothetical protein
MIESEFIKEFFIISNIYRNMNNILKDKLVKNNIALNETEIIILFLLSEKNQLTTEEMLKIGYFSSSNLLFNLNSLNNNSYVKSENFKEDNPLKATSSLSLNGSSVLSNVNRICKNINTNCDKNFIDLLIKYQTNINKLSEKNKK